MDASHDRRPVNPHGPSATDASSRRGARVLPQADKARRTSEPTAGWYDADSVTYHGHVDAGDTANGDVRDREVVAGRTTRDTWMSDFDH